MPTVPVAGYALIWATKGEGKKGKVKLKLQNGKDAELLADGQELAALAAILKESPVYYGTDTGVLATDWEQVGD